MCGAGNRDHAIRLRYSIGAARDGFLGPIDTLQDAIGTEISVGFRLHARFFAIRPADFIFDIQQGSFPDVFDAFVDAFSENATRASG